MTRKDYILIADAFKFAYEKAGNRPMPYASEMMDNVEAMAGLVADKLETDNSRFDREHFLAVVRGEKDLNSRPAKEKGL